MTEREIARELRRKWTNPRIARKGKLKMRFGSRLQAEIASTQEKLELLCELERERYAEARR